MENSNIADIAFTKSRILMGVNFEKKVVLKAYGNAAVRVHPIPDSGLTAVQARLNYGIFDAIEDLAGLGLGEDEIDTMMENGDHTETLQKIAKLKIPARLFQYVYELCRLGIVPVPDPECPDCHGKKQPGASICPTCDTRDIVDQIIGFSTLEIGAVILGMSMGDWEATESFFGLKKAASGPESLPSKV